MTIYNVLHYPDERLRTKAEPVEQVTNEIKTLVDDMFETMYNDNGIGLAATQINVHKRIIAIDVSETRDQRLTLINPEILELKGEEEMEEGCLSVPYIYDSVKRAAWIKVRALNREGEVFEFETAGLLAVCIQHEIDHLNGKLFIDYLSNLKRERILSKIKKLQRHIL